MQPLPPQIITVAGHVVQPINVTTIMGNIVTFMCSTNRRPTLLRPFTPEDLREWRTQALQFANDSHLSELVKMLKEGPKVPSPTVIFLQRYATVAAMLVTEPRYEQDAGGALRHDLLKAGGWSELQVTSPSLGYSRGYLHLDVDPGTENPPFDLPSWDGGTAGAGATGFRDAVAMLCQLLDRPALSDALVPAQESLVVRNPKEAFFGGAKVAIQQAERLTAVGLLYQRQADAFMLRVNQSLWDMCYQLASALYPRELPVLEYYAKLRSSVLAAIPCHPVLESIANRVGHTVMHTIYGDKQVAYRHGVDMAAPQTGAPRDDRGTGLPTSALASLMVVQAAAEAARMRALIAAGERWPTAWVQDAAPDVSPERAQAMIGAPGASIGIGGLMEWVSRHGNYVTHWSEIARQLGWSGAVASPEIDIMAAAADFVLTDGDWYSAEPSAVLAGLRPGLSLGNVKAAGAKIRFEDHFGTGPDVTESPNAADGGESAPVAARWSTITVPGHQNAVDAVHVFASFYLPIGMLMGEMNGQVKMIAPGDDDHIGSAVQRFYRERSPNGFVKQWYGPPSSKLSTYSAGLIYMNTSWDAAVEGTDAGKVQSTLLASYGADNVDKQPISVYVFRDRWNMRVPVMMARPNHFEWYDEIGGFLGNIEYDGAVAFDDKIEMAHRADKLMPYVDLLHVAAPRIEDPANTEVKPPEQARTL